MANTTEKMTNAKALTYVLDNFGAELPTEVAEKLTTMLNKTTAKAKSKVAAEDKPENVELRGKILDILADYKAHQCAEIGAELGISTSKASSLLGTLQDSGTVIRETVKGKVMYTLAPTAEMIPDEAE